MADVAINTDTRDYAANAGSGWRTVASSDGDTVYSFLVASDDDLKYHKSTDGGATFGTAVAVRTGNVPCFDIWADWWTQGDSGTKIHIWWVDSGDVYYRNLDTATDILSTEETIHTSTEAGIANTGVTGTKAQGGNLYVFSRLASGVAVFYRSTDGGDNWTSRTSPFEDTTDLCLLFPSNSSDSNDIWNLYADVSALELSVKTYDDSANTWPSEVAVCAYVVISSATAFPTRTGAIRHSDENLILAIRTDVDTATADLRTFKFDGTTVTELTAILTDIDDVGPVCLSIDQNNDDIYVGYLGKADGSETYTSTVKAYYKKSTDDGATWGSEVPYSEDTGDDFRHLWCDLGSTNYRFSLVWWDDDDNDLFTGITNSVEIEAPAAGTVPLRTLMGVGV